MVPLAESANWVGRGRVAADVDRAAVGVGRAGDAIERVVGMERGLALAVGSSNQVRVP